MQDRIPVDAARTLLLSAQGLLDDPARRGGPAATQKLIERMGYVQLDSINVIARAHDLTLAARLDSYQPPHLSELLEQRRSLFEHWTHDAAAIPAEFLPQWRLRFRRFEEYYANRAAARARLGKRPEAVVAEVMRRIRREGPLMSRDFAQDRHDAAPSSGGWWNWGYQKAALEYGWRTGRLAVSARREFQKVYDLRERVFPELRTLRNPSEARYIDWACSSALERMGAGTTSEIAQFWGGLRGPQAAKWCQRAAANGRIQPVEFAGEKGAKPSAGFAVVDWRERLRRAPSPPDRIRLLSPFDPVIRDRARLLRLFDFDYRIEVFVPKAKRQYGYYVLPIMEGDRLIGRLDPKFHRDRGVLEVLGLWWEPGLRMTPARRRGLDQALERCAQLIGATEVRFAKEARR